MPQPSRGARVAGYALAVESPAMNTRTGRSAPTAAVAMHRPAYASSSLNRCAMSRPRNTGLARLNTRGRRAGRRGTDGSPHRGGRRSSARSVKPRSACQPATVDRDHRAVDVVRGTAGQEHRGAAQVGRLAPARGGDAVEDRLVALGIRTQLRGVVGGHVAWRDRVDVHALRAP